MQIHINTSKNLEKFSTKKKIAKSIFTKETHGPAFAVLLLHGLGAPADELQYFAANMWDQFGDSALIIQPTCRAGMQSVSQCIHHQAEKVFKHIQFEIRECRKEPKSFPLIIIGYSTGGVLACVLGNVYQDQLNIRGIGTLNAPLRGVPVLECSYPKVRNFISKAQKGLQPIVYPRSLFWIERQMELSALVLTIMRSKWIPKANGTKDILPNSTCVKGVYQFLRNTAHNIPCLLMGSYQNDFGVLFHKTIFKDHSATIAELNNAYSQLITGKEGAKHDTLIPLHSQLCKGDGFAANIQTRIYKGKIHCRNLVVINRNVFVDNIDASVLYSKQILTDLIQFIKEVKGGAQR